MNLSGTLISLGAMVLGGAIGSMIPAVGPVLGAAIGGSIGGMLGAALFPEKLDFNHPPHPKPRENRQQISTYGAPIPIIHGSARIAGNIIYMQDVNQTIIQSKHRQDGVRYFEYDRLYTSTFAIAFCEGPVIGIARIWVNNSIFVDFRDPDGPYYPTGSTSLASGNLSTSIAASEVYFSIHFGTEDQTDDTTLSGILGDDCLPYRGICYIVFIDFPVGEFSGIPRIEIELVESDEIVSGSPGINPVYDWTNLDFTTFSETDPGGDITILSSSAVNITRTSGDGSVCYLEKSLSISGDYQFRFKVTVNSIGTMTNSSRVLRLCTLNTSYVGNFWFDDGPPTYDYSIGLVDEATAQHYATATLTRYVKLVQSKSLTQMTIYIYTDSGYSDLEFSQSDYAAGYGADISSIKIFDAYSAYLIAYDLTIENLQYKPV